MEQHVCVFECVYFVHVCLYINLAISVTHNFFFCFVYFCFCLDSSTNFIYCPHILLRKVIYEPFSCKIQNVSWFVSCLMELFILSQVAIGGQRGCNVD